MTKLNDSTRKMITNVTACTSFVTGGFVGGIIIGLGSRSNPITKLIANVSGIAIAYTVAEAVYNAWTPLICETVNDIIKLKKDIDNNQDIQKDPEKEKMDKVATALEKIKQRTEEEKNAEKDYIDIFGSAIKAGTLPADYVASIPAVKIVGDCDDCSASEKLDKNSVDISDITKE